MEKLNISDESCFGRNEHFNKRESERLLKDAHVISPQSFDVVAPRKEKHQEFSNLDGKQQSVQTAAPEEEVKEEKNLIYESTVVVSEASENGKRMLRTVQDVSKE